MGLRILPKEAAQGLRGYGCLLQIAISFSGVRSICGVELIKFERPGEKDGNQPQ